MNIVGQNMVLDLPKPQQQYEGRNAAADNAKGLLIIMVVAGHVYFIPDASALVELIYLLHMPAFLALGLLFVKPLTLPYLLDRAKRLLIPFVVMISVGPAVGYLLFYTFPKFLRGHIPDTGPLIWLVCWLLTLVVWALSFSATKQSPLFGRLKLGVFYCWILVGILSLGYNLWQEPTYGPTLLKQILWGNWHHVRSVFWFLPALFTLTILGAGLLRLPAKYRWWTIMVIGLGTWALLPQLIEFHPNIPWGLDVALVLLPLAMAARWLKQVHDLGDSDKSRWQSWMVFAIILGFAYRQIPISTVQGYSHKVDVSQLNLPWLWLPLVFGLSYYYWSALISYRRPTWLSYIGQRTMPIFALHLPLMATMRQLTNTVAPWPWLQFTLIVLAGVAIPILVASVLSRIDKRFSYWGLA